MKKWLLMLMVMLVGVSEMMAGPKITGTFEVIIARPKRDCKSGVWVCTKVFDINVEWGTQRAVKTEIQDNGDGTVTLTFLTKLPESSSSFYADADEISTLPAEMARKMGYSEVLLVPGNYQINQATNGNFGSVTIRYKTK